MTEFHVERDKRMAELSRRLRDRFFDLRAQGFDLSEVELEPDDDIDPRDRRIVSRPACSQCAVLVINGTPCHETGCANAKKSCAGCGDLIPAYAGRFCGNC